MGIYEEGRLLFGFLCISALYPPLPRFANKQMKKQTNTKYRNKEAEGRTEQRDWNRENEGEEKKERLFKGLNSLGGPRRIVCLFL